MHPKEPSCLVIVTDGTGTICKSLSIDDESDEFTICAFFSEKDLVNDILWVKKTNKS